MIIDKFCSFISYRYLTITFFYSRSHEIVPSDCYRHKSKETSTALLCLRSYYRDPPRHIETFTAFFIRRRPNVGSIGPGSFFMSAFVPRFPASQIHTKSEYSVRETSKRQSIPNPLSGECSIKTRSKLRESLFRVSRSIERGRDEGGTM